MRIKLEQTCGLTVIGRKQSDLTYNSANYEGREQSNLTYNLQTNCDLTVVEREHSDLTYNLQTNCGLTVVGWEHSDLTHNIAHCDADCC